MAPLFGGAEPFVHYVRMRHEEQFRELIFYLNQWLREIYGFKIFLI